MAMEECTDTQIPQTKTIEALTGYLYWCHCHSERLEMHYVPGGGGGAKSNLASPLHEALQRHERSLLLLKGFRYSKVSILRVRSRHPIVTVWYIV